MESVVGICREVLKRLSQMDYERKGGSSKQRLIFPNTFPAIKEGKIFTEEELLKYTRISEQELRFLFVEEFLKEPNNGYYYSVETPTKGKYKFGKKKEDIPLVADNGQSASIDLCILQRVGKEYKRNLNIEFKYDNVSIKDFSKDNLKLMHEEENGAFVLLLKNTDTGTVKSVFKKFASSFVTHKEHWNKLKPDKQIELVILSLEERDNRENGKPFIMYRTISERNIDSMDNSIDNWKKEVLVDGKFNCFDLIKAKIKTTVDEMLMVK